MPHFMKSSIDKNPWRRRDARWNLGHRCRDDQMKAFLLHRIRRGDDHVHIISEFVSSNESDTQNDDASSEAETKTNIHCAYFDLLTSSNAVDDTETNAKFMTNMISDILSAENTVDIEQEFCYDVHQCR